jgi:protein-disulfide isomerase
MLLMVQVVISVVIVTRLNNLDARLSVLSVSQVSSNNQAPAHVDGIPVEGAPSQGTKGAPIILIEFSDYECPFCQQANSVIDNILHDYSGKILFIYKDFPLEDLHPHALKAAEAANCASEQNQYWQMHNLLFSTQDKLTIVDLKQDAVQLGLNVAQFNTCLDNEKYADAIRKSISDGLLAGVNATPTFFVNGDRVVGGNPDALRQSIEKNLAKGT